MDRRTFKVRCSYFTASSAGIPMRITVARRRARLVMSDLTSSFQASLERSTGSRSPCLRTALLLLGHTNDWGMGHCGSAVEDVNRLRRRLTQLSSTDLPYAVHGVSGRVNRCRRLLRSGTAQKPLRAEQMAELSRLNAQAAELSSTIIAPCPAAQEPRPPTRMMLANRLIRLFCPQLIPSRLLVRHKAVSLQRRGTRT